MLGSKENDEKVARATSSQAKRHENLIPAAKYKEHGHEESGEMIWLGPGTGSRAKFQHLFLWMLFLWMLFVLLVVNYFFGLSFLQI